MTVIVPKDSNKRKVQSTEVASRNKGQHKSGMPIKVTRKNEGVLPPTISASQRTTMPVGGGVEAYNERCLCVMYRSQRVHTSFYESAPSASDSLGNTIPQGVTEDSGNARANIPNASEELNLGNISRHSRVLFERILVMQGIWRVASSYRLKTTGTPH